MDSLEKEIYEKIIERMEVDEALLEGFTCDSPIFAPKDGDADGTLGLDSLDAFELVVLIYEEWGIDVPTEDIQKLTTVSKTAQYIREHS